MRAAGIPARFESLPASEGNVRLDIRANHCWGRILQFSGILAPGGRHEAWKIPPSAIISSAASRRQSRSSFLHLRSEPRPPSLPLQTAPAQLLHLYPTPNPTATRKSLTTPSLSATGRPPTIGANKSDGPILCRILQVLLRRTASNFPLPLSPFRNFAHDC